MSTNRFMKSSNPFLKQERFAQGAVNHQEALDSHLSFNRDASVMTVQGAVNKTMILTGILVASAFFSIAYLPFSTTLFYGGIFGALGVLMFSYFKPTATPITAPLYALLEGYILGHLSYIIAAMVGSVGIVVNAILLTILCLATMLMAYKTGLIKPTEKFRSVITTATGAIMLIYLINLGMHMFGSGIPYLHEGGIIGIGISLVILGIASLNLILDFDNMERGAQMGAPKYMEWATGLGLLVTLVWIYIEILSLLSRLSSD